MDVKLNKKYVRRKIENKIQSFIICFIVLSFFTFYFFFTMKSYEKCICTINLLFIYVTSRHITDNLCRARFISRLDSD